MIHHKDHSGIVEFTVRDNVIVLQAGEADVLADTVN
jgi:hypothetical protein